MMSSPWDTLSFPRLRKMLFFLALTGALGGLQGVFSVQTAMGSPYLMSLGYSKPVLSFIWLAGPLAGVIGQPYFGLCSDQCRISWGRRKIFIAGGALIIVISLPMLAWTEDIVKTMAWVLTDDQNNHVVQTAIKIVAALLIWILNFAIQPLQCGLRALIVETCPPEKMDTANVWASRMISIGSILGYGSGFIDVSQLLFIGDSHAQFKALAIFAACGLTVTVLACGCLIQERDPNEDGPPSRELESTIGKFKHVYRSIANIPPQVAVVCRVQLCSWFGWFSFMYYITTYIGEICKRLEHSHYACHSKLIILDLRDVRPVTLAAQNEANRHGELALLFFAFFQLFASILAPYLIARPESDLQLIPTTFISRKTPTPRFLAESSLCRLWIISHAIFATCMFSTLFVTRSVTGATIIVGFVGISAALSQIVPFTLISLILSRQHERAIYGLTSNNKTTLLSPPLPSSVSASSSSLNNNDDDDTNSDMTLINEKHTTPTFSTTSPPLQPGMILGIHNISIAFPQLISALGSSLIFTLLGRDSKSENGGDESRSTAWVLRAGGVAALAAIWMTMRLRERSWNDGPKRIEEESERDRGSRWRWRTRS